MLGISTPKSDPTNRVPPEVPEGKGVQKPSGLFTDLLSAESLRFPARPYWIEAQEPKPDAGGGFIRLWTALNSTPCKAGEWRDLNQNNYSSLYPAVFKVVAELHAGGVKSCECRQALLELESINAAVGHKGEMHTAALESSRIGGWLDRQLLSIDAAVINFLQTHRQKLWGKAGGVVHSFASGPRRSQYFAWPFSLGGGFLGGMLISSVTDSRLLYVPLAYLTTFSIYWPVYWWRQRQVERRTCVRSDGSFDGAEWQRLRSRDWSFVRNSELLYFVPRMTTLGALAFFGITGGLGNVVSQLLANGLQTVLYNSVYRTGMWNTFRQILHTGRIKVQEIVARFRK